MLQALLGLLLSLFSLVMTVLIMLFLPSLLCTMLWNSLVFGVFHGTAISLFQGVLLWLMIILTVLIVFKPEIKVSVQRINTKDIPFPSPKKRDPSNPTDQNTPSAHWLKWREDKKKNTPKDPKDAPPSSLH